jgi:hypothetical protein
VLTLPLLYVLGWEIIALALLVRIIVCRYSFQNLENVNFNLNVYLFH